MIEGPPKRSSKLMAWPPAQSLRWLVPRDFLVSEGIRLCFGHRHNAINSRRERLLCHDRAIEDQPITEAAVKRIDLFFHDSNHHLPKHDR
jgi:hypothetical protein